MRDDDFGFSFAYLGIEIEVDHHAVAKDGDNSKEKVDDAKEVVPHGVDWWVAVPVLVNEALHLVRHKVHHSHALGVTHVGQLTVDRGEKEGISQ